MSLIMQPAHVPLGWVEIRPGVRLPVFINPPWQRSLSDVPAAVAAASSEGPPSFMFVEDAAASDEPLMIPAPPAPPAPPQTVLMLLCDEYVEGEPMFIPR